MKADHVLLQGAACNEYKSALQARFFVDARRTNRATMYVTCACLTLQLQAVQAHATYEESLLVSYRPLAIKSIQTSAYV